MTGVANIAKASSSNESPNAESKNGAEPSQNSDGSRPIENEKTIPKKPETLKDDAMKAHDGSSGDMQAEIECLKLQIHELRMMQQKDREKLEGASEEDTKPKTRSTSEAKPPAMPLARNIRLHPAEKVGQNLDHSMDQVEVAHPAGEAERNETQACPALTISNTGQNSQPDKSKDGLPSFWMIHRVDWTEFQTSLPVFAIDVLMGEPCTKAKQPSLGPTSAADLPKPIPRARPQGHGPLAERIRINSKPVIKILGTIFQEDLSSDLEPVLMMRPFRGLVWYKDEIRKFRDNLEKHLIEEEMNAPKTQTEQSTAADDESKKPTEAHDEKETLTEKESQKESEDTDDKPQSDQEKGNDTKPTTNKPPDDIVAPEKEVKKDNDDRRAENQGSDNNDEGSLTNSEHALKDLSCLVAFIKLDIEDKIAYLASEECTKVFWADIWYLFKPGDFVISKDEKQAYRVIKVRYPTHGTGVATGRDRFTSDNSPIAIQCVYLDCDGERIGPVTQTINIHRFEGEKSIRSLPVVPLRCTKTSDLKNTLIKRGSTFMSMCDPQRRGIPMYYSGVALETKEKFDSQVVIDFEEAFTPNEEGGRTSPSGQTHDRQTDWKPRLKDIDASSDSITPCSSDILRECCSNENVHNDVYVEYRQTDAFVQGQFREEDKTSDKVPLMTIAARPLSEVTKDENDIADEDRLIMSYRVFGFVLRSKKWAKLDLTYLRPMKEKTPFDLLVLPEGHKEMVENLVTQHFLNKASTYDDSDENNFVRGKGRGLVFLLHGAPGVGKTTTAECVAAYFQKPLFQITCGDLGSTADVVESGLQKNFDLASRWGCIALIDEADVFLEARQTGNLCHNNLVAAFLRTLEYYSGVLFLTTNRVGIFDEVFTSHIHISLYYPPLSQASTLAVFKVHLTRIQARFEKKKARGEAELELDERSVNEFILDYFTENKDARWNGRQIRNACQTALALAEFEGQKLANPDTNGGRSVMEIAAKSKKRVKVKLTKKHFEDVAKPYLELMKYVRGAHGASAAQQANNSQLCQDGYESGDAASLLASQNKEYAPEPKTNQGQRCSDKPSGRQEKQIRKKAHRPRHTDYLEAAVAEEEYADDYYGHDQDLMQNKDDGRDFKKEPSFNEEDDYDEGFEEHRFEEYRPVRSKKATKSYVDDYKGDRYQDDHIKTAKHRSSPSQPARRVQPARGSRERRDDVGSFHSSTPRIMRREGELTRLKSVFEGAQRLLEGPNGARLESSQELRTTLIQCTTQLEDLATTLRERLERRKWGKFMGKLRLRTKWPFESGDTDKIIHNLCQFRDALSACLTVDQMQVLETNERIKILSWISSIPYGKHHNAIKEARTYNTCEWILQDRRFKEWEHCNTSMLLWLQGSPGTGKTFSTSKVVDHIKNATRNSPNRENQAFFYCNRNEDERRKPIAVLRSWIRQLSTVSENTEQIPKQIRRLHHQAIHEASDLTLEICRRCLLELTDLFSGTTLILDALDECESDSRGKLIEAIEFLLTHSKNPLRIFISSRPEGDIRERFQSRPYVEIHASNNRGDIARFVKTEIASHRRWNTMSPPLQHHISRTLIGHSNGMFQWAGLQVKQLLELLTEAAIMDRLGKLPPDLKTTYDEIYNKINVRNRHEKVLADRALMIVMCSPTSLNNVELLTAIRLDSDANNLHLSEKIDENLLLDLCNNLLVLDKQEKSITQLKVFLGSPKKSSTYYQQWFAEVLYDMKKQLAFTSFSNQLMREISPSSISLFAVFRLSLSEILLDWWDRAEIPPSLTNHWGDNLLTIAALSGATTACQALLRRGFCINPEDKRQNSSLVSASPTNACVDIGEERKPRSAGTPYGHSLIAAASQGHIDVARYLLAQGADVNFSGGKLGSALAAAVRNIDIINLLLDNGADVNLRLEHGESALMAAVRNGRIDTMKLLLAKGADFQQQHPDYASPLDVAVKNGFDAIVRVLVEQGARVNLRNGAYGNAFVAAASIGGDTDTLKILIQRVAAVNMKLSTLNCGFALIPAASKGHLENMELLIKQGADVNLQSRTMGYHNNSALAAASRSGNAGAIKLLIQHGADVNLRLKYGGEGSALAVAAMFGHTPIVKFLVRKGADVNIRPYEGQCGVLRGAAQYGDIRMLRFLVKQGAGVNSPLRTMVLSEALEAAVYELHIESVKFLIKQGADSRFVGWEEEAGRRVNTAS
ncbi:hypothetical protein F53441_8046 [Fusarium austroafricanum]|uniref:AAA+ ATPase domain-containing protein n=1 Tax=Fusarium austroafricanum TaxID=2364996 RepID=A0A8H4KG95_9HYPO|nr:hypothetical protein F53441_8046 [Fusarium austroafricanum]